VHSDQRASGRVGVAVYPWEVTIDAPSASDGARNAFTAPISGLAPEAGRMLARVGPLTAEASREELERLGLRRGEPARARFSPASARLLALDGEVEPQA
jgi:hypothetical protein